MTVKDIEYSEAYACIAAALCFNTTYFDVLLDEIEVEEEEEHDFKRKFNEVS